MIDEYAAPPELAVALRANGRLELGARDARFPAAVGALFDLLEAHGWRVSDAAGVLGVSTAAIGRFLETDVAVLRAAESGGTDLTPHAAAYRELLIDLLATWDRELERDASPNHEVPGGSAC